jgi:hypothetical protein
LHVPDSNIYLVSWPSMAGQLLMKASAELRRNVREWGNVKRGA